ncbi:MAG: hypothetical protein LBP62_06610 [Clostridiales bacterium]|jgi:UDP-N-acetylmuramoylalanine--D-glutamate ligase|nr:hypothetical protein [Clostridiales bacterium]
MGKNILIVGFKRSGIAAAELLNSFGHSVYACDRSGIVNPPDFVTDRSGFLIECESGFLPESNIEVSGKQDKSDFIKENSGFLPESNIEVSGKQDKSDFVKDNGGLLSEGEKGNSEKENRFDFVKDNGGLLSRDCVKNSDKNKNFSDAGKRGGFDALLDGIDTAVISPSVSINSEIVRECKKRVICVVGEIESAFSVFIGEPIGGVYEKNKSKKGEKFDRESESDNKKIEYKKDEKFGDKNEYLNDKKFNGENEHKNSEKFNGENEYKNGVKFDGENKINKEENECKNGEKFNEKNERNDKKNEYKNNEKFDRQNECGNNEKFDRQNEYKNNERKNNEKFNAGNECRREKNDLLKIEKPMANRREKMRNITAVTGTNGKTTTTLLIDAVYKAAGIKCAALGNVGRAFSDFYKDDIDTAVLEVSSFQLESIKTFRPNIAIFLNFAPDHLDRHRDIDEYFAAKLRIFENQTIEDFAVVNYDDKYLREYFDRSECRNMRADKSVNGDKYSSEHFNESGNISARYNNDGNESVKGDKYSGEHFNESGNISARYNNDGNENVNGDKYLSEPFDGSGYPHIHSELFFFSAERHVKGAYVEDGEIFFDDGNEVHFVCDTGAVGIRGGHNLENALAVVCAAKLMDIQNDFIISAFRNFSLPHNRIEFVGRIGGTDFFNDSKATNIHAAAAAARSMDGDFALILGGSDKGEDFRVLFDRLSDNVNAVFVTGGNAEKIMSAAKEKNFGNIKKTDTLRESVEAAYESGAKNVLFSPASASFDRYENYEERGRIFAALVEELRRNRLGITE